MPTFVGRDAELSALTADVERALAGEGRSFYVVGPPGVGKTAFVAELLRRVGAARPDVAIARGRCLQTYGSGDPYLPFVDALRDLSDESTAGFIRGETLGGLVRELAPYWLSVVPMVGGLLSATFATAAELRKPKADEVPSREALFVQYLELVRNLAARQPLILFLDDLHWADPSSVALLAHLSRGILTQRVALIGTLRPVEVEIEHHPVAELLRELERESAGRRVELGELDLAAMRALMGAELGGDVAEPLHRWMARTAGGNPLFVSELCRLLKQDGGAVARRGEWQLTDAAQRAAVPRSAEAVIEQRVERLESEDVRLLQYASVQGNSFDSVMLSRLLERDELDVLDRLEALERRHQLVRAEGEQALPQGEPTLLYRFSHALVQTVLYGQVVGKRRILLHRKAGDVLASLYAGEEAVVASRLARHYHEGRRPEQARPHARLAAESAFRLYAHWEAEEMFRLALESGPEPAESAELRERLADVYDEVGHYDDAVAAYQAALDASPDAATALRLRRKMVHVERKGGLTPASELLERVRGLIAVAGSELEERCWLLLELVRLPDAEGVVEAAAECVDIASGLDAPLLQAYALEQLAVALLFNRQTEEALAPLQRAVEIAREVDDPRRTTRYRGIVGVVHARLGHYQDAREEFQLALAAAERIGDPDLVGVACNNLGAVMLRVGEYDAAEVALQRARGLHARRTRSGLLQSLYNLAERARLSGETVVARERYEEVIEVAREIGYWSSEAIGWAGVGLCRLAGAVGGELAAARQAAERALAATADRHDWFEDRDLLELFLARLERAEGESAAARARLERAAAELAGRDVYLWARMELERARMLLNDQPAGALGLLDATAEATAGMQSPPLVAELGELREAARGRVGV